MQLPVDVKALIDEATNIKAAQATELSVSVYVDETAPAELIAHVRSMFASTSPTVRMMLSYLDRNFYPNAEDDIAVIVAGDSAKVGAAAKVLRAANVPVMVATLSPAAVAERAIAGGCDIPEGDIVAPTEGIEGAEEPYELNDATTASFDDRVGSWIVAVCREKRLAFAVAFPFMRRSLARDAVQATSLQNAGIGLVPLIPGADLPIMTLNQAKMVLQIAAAYGCEMGKDRLKELAAVIGGAYACRTLARELVEFVPVLGFAVRTGVAYGGTAALGHAVIEYFEGGANASGVANVASRAKETGKKLVSKVRSAVADPKSLGLADKVTASVPAVRSKATEVVPLVREKVGEYVPKFVDAATDVVSKAVAK